MPPREALLKAQLAQQQLIAVGNAYASAELTFRRRAKALKSKNPVAAGFLVLQNGTRAQCTASFFSAAAVFFGSVSCSTPSVYFARAFVSSTSWPSVKTRWILPK